MSSFRVDICRHLSRDTNSWATQRPQTPAMDEDVHRQQGARGEGALTKPTGDGRLPAGSWNRRPALDVRRTGVVSWTSANTWPSDGHSIDVVRHGAEK